jgi:sec-independent protein translocase protein TatC
MALVPFPNKSNPAAEEEPQPDWDEADRDDDGGKMSFLEHLDELRRRLLRSVIALFVGFLIACVFLPQLFTFVMNPIHELIPGGKLIYTEPTEAFALYIKIAVIAGLLIASPAIMTQVWLFIAPGLYAHEKKMAIPFVAMSSVFFIGGAAFAHYVVFPMTFEFLASFSNDLLTMTPRVEPTFGLYMKLVLAMGLVFQMPTIVLFLAKLGVLTARFLVKNLKYAVLVIFVVAAVITPDGSPITQAAMAGPMLLLYFFSIGLAWMFGKKRAPADV